MGTSHEALVTLGFIVPEPKLVTLLNILLQKRRKGPPERDEELSYSKSDAKKLSEDDAEKLQCIVRDLVNEEGLGDDFEVKICKFGYGGGKTGMVVSFFGSYNDQSNTMYRGFGAMAWGRDNVTPAVLELPELNKDEVDVRASEEMIQKLQETFHLKQLGVEVEKKWILRVECTS